VGYSDAEIKQIADPRTMLLLKRLSDLMGEKGAAAEAVKKVRQAPKVLRGRGKPKPKTNEVSKKLTKQAQRSGDKHDALAAAKAILAGK